MVRSRIEHAHAVVLAALRELDVADPQERRMFEACLVAVRRLGEVRDLCDERAADERRAAVRLRAA
jgi:hypothetical protein